MFAKNVILFNLILSLYIFCPEHAFSSRVDEEELRVRSGRHAQEKIEERDLHSRITIVPLQQRLAALRTAQEQYDLLRACLYNDSFTQEELECIAAIFFVPEILNIHPEDPLSHIEVLNFFTKEDVQRSELILQQIAQQHNDQNKTIAAMFLISSLRVNGMKELENLYGQEDPRDFLKNGRIGLTSFKEIAQQPDHPDHLQAARFLLLRNEEHIGLLRHYFHEDDIQECIKIGESALWGVAQQPDHPQQKEAFDEFTIDGENEVYEHLERLFTGGNKVERENAHEVIKKIALSENENDNIKYRAGKILFTYGESEEDKEIGRTALKKIVLRYLYLKESPFTRRDLYNIARFFIPEVVDFFSEEPPTSSYRDIAASISISEPDVERFEWILHDIAQQPEALYHTTAAKILMDSLFINGNKELASMYRQEDPRNFQKNWRVGLTALKKIARQPHHPDHLEVARFLFLRNEEHIGFLKNHLHEDDIQKSIRVGKSALWEIAQQPGHPQQKEAFDEFTIDGENEVYEHLEKLFTGGSREDKENAHEIIKKVALSEDENDNIKYRAAKTLFTYGESEEDTHTGISVLRKIAYKAGHTRQYDAAEGLFYCGDDNDQKRSIRLFWAIYTQEDHPDKNKARDMLKSLKRYPEGHKFNTHLYL